MYGDDENYSPELREAIAVLNELKTEKPPLSMSELMRQRDEALGLSERMRLENEDLRRRLK